MTKLNRPIAREVERQQAGSRPIIVSLIPADETHEVPVPAMLEFREKGRRTRFTLPVGAAYQEAIRREVARKRDERAKARGQKRTVRRGSLATDR